MIVGDGVLGVAVQRLLQTLSRLRGVSLPDLNLSPIDQSLAVGARILQDLIVELVGFV